MILELICLLAGLGIGLIVGERWADLRLRAHHPHLFRGR
jgi:hypothetical protein